MRQILASEGPTPPDWKSAVFFKVTLQNVLTRLYQNWRCYTFTKYFVIKGCVCVFVCDVLNVSVHHKLLQLSHVLVVIKEFI